MDPSGSGRDGPDLPPPPPEVEPSYDDNQNASGNGIKVRKIEELEELQGFAVSFTCL